MKRIVSSTVAVALLAGTLIAAATGSATAEPATAAAPTPAAPGAYVPLAPVRALDTRAAGGGGALGQAETRSVTLRQQLPSVTASAVVLNLTVDAPTAPGYLTVFPAGASRPTSSSVNRRVGETRSNSVTVALPADGTRTLGSSTAGRG